MEVLNLTAGYFRDGKTPLHKPYPYSFHRWGFLHFRYLKGLVTKPTTIFFWLVVSTYSEKIFVNLGSSSPIFGMKTKTIWVATTQLMYMIVSENRGISPQIIHFNRVFHYFHLPFWGFPPIFWKHPHKVPTAYGPKKHPLPWTKWVSSEKILRVSKTTHHFHENPRWVQNRKDPYIQESYNTPLEHTPGIFLANYERNPFVACW